jgi:hypothetical protein
MKSAVCAVSVVVCSSMLAGAAGEIVSGPEPGKAVPSLPVYVATGAQAEKTVDFVQERRDKPTVFFIVQHAYWGRPVARFLKTLDAALEQDANGAEGVAVWFSDDPAALKEHLPRVQTSLNFAKTVLGVYEGKKIGPDGWALNDAAPVTVLYVVKGKVVKNLAFDTIDEASAPAALEAIKAK